VPKTLFSISLLVVLINKADVLLLSVSTLSKNTLPPNLLCRLPAVPLSILVTLVPKFVVCSSVAPD
jgi:hypothetical protein